MKQKIKAGIIGGAGYTGGELLRLLVHHPHVEMLYVVSKSQAGKPVSLVHTDLYGDTGLSFVAEPGKEADVVFLCMSHGEAKKYLEQNSFLLASQIIDLSRDFRIQSGGMAPDGEHASPDAECRIKNFAYGLPELNKEKIKGSQYVANPGCFATAIQLGLLPLAEKGLLKSEIHVNATTGSTGAGQSLSASTHFSWRNNNLSVYKAFEHEHLAEINQSLKQLQNGFCADLHFIPQRGAFTRGILASISTSCDLRQEELTSLYQSFYETHPFVRIVESVDIKQVVNTNKCFIQLIKHNKQVAIISAIDNLLKGASGQAVQNMNLMFGLEETSGLKLKANVY